MFLIRVGTHSDPNLGELIIDVGNLSDLGVELVDPGLSHLSVVHGAAQVGLQGVDLLLVDLDLNDVKITLPSVYVESRNNKVEPMIVEVVTF